MPVQVTVQVQMQVLLQIQVPVQVLIQVPTQVSTQVRMSVQVKAAAIACLHEQKSADIWLDWATIQFRFIGHAATYIGSFCVFGPALSSPAHALPSLACTKSESK
jgi:hypothetical protein